MERILAVASQLGKMIADTDRFKAMRAAEAAAQGDEDAPRALQELQSFEDEIARNEMAGKPIEVEEKRRLAALRERVQGNEKLQALAKAQADYMELMSRVNSAVQEHLGIEGVSHVP